MLGYRNAEVGESLFSLLRRSLLCVVGILDLSIGRVVYSRQQ